MNTKSEGKLNIKISSSFLGVMLHQKLKPKHEVQAQTSDLIISTVVKPKKSQLSSAYFEGAGVRGHHPQRNASQNRLTPSIFPQVSSQ